MISGEVGLVFCMGFRSSSSGYKVFVGLGSVELGRPLYAQGHGCVLRAVEHAGNGNE